jgi:hypothetical protein
MKTRMAFVGLLIAVPLQAQQMPPAPQSPRFTLGVTGGGASASGDLGTSSWQTGWSAAANLMYRLSSKMGVRADAGFSQNDLNGTAAVPGAQSFDKMSYLASAVWQKNGMTPSRAKPMPYLLAGLGAIRVSDKGSDSSFTNVAGNLGLGVGYSLGKFGLRAEGRDLIYKFDHFGYNKTQNDFLWQAGVTLGI